MNENLKILFPLLEGVPKEKPLKRHRNYVRISREDTSSMLNC